MTHADPSPTRPLVHQAQVDPVTDAARRGLEQILARLPGLRLTGHEPPSGFAFRRPAVMHLTWNN